MANRGRTPVVMTSLWGINQTTMLVTGELYLGTGSLTCSQKAVIVSSQRFQGRLLRRSMIRKYWVLMYQKIRRLAMTVYVDTMRARYHRMIMCHMIADSSEELDAMADRIGVSRRWKQDSGTWREHYDICLTKRAMAVREGAIEISQMELGRILIRRKI